MGVDISGVDILGVDILGVDILGRTLSWATVQEVGEFKIIPFRQFLQYWKAKHEFESVWKTVVESVGQACKRLRSKQPQ